MPMNEFEELAGRYDLVLRQSQLVEAVLAEPGVDPASLAPPGLQALPGIPGGLSQALRVHRADACALADRALSAIYPRLRRHMDTAWRGSFAALAWACWREQPPAQGDLGDWGEALIDRLAAAGPAVVPACWLALARIEWTLHAVSRQGVTPPDLSSLALLGRLPAGAVRLVLAEHVSLHRGEDLNEEDRRALTLPGIEAGMEADIEAGNDADIDGRNAMPRRQRDVAGLLVWRDAWSGRVQALDEPTWRWCEALLDGLDLEHALRETGPGFDFADWLSTAVVRGWLARVESVEMAVASGAAPHEAWSLPGLRR